MVIVIETETCNNETSEWDNRYLEKIGKIKLELRESPMSEKPLGYPFLREKRIFEKRIYYLVYLDLGVVLLVGASDKKNQERTIGLIKLAVPSYRKMAEDVVKQRA